MVAVMSTHTRLCQVVPLLPVSRAYTYRIPSGLSPRIDEGSRVVVPVGSREVVGVVVGWDGEEQVRIKEVQGVLDPEPALLPGVLDLTRRASQYYLEPWGLYLRCSLPPGLRKGRGPVVPMTRWVVYAGPSPQLPTRRQRELLNRLESVREVPLRTVIAEWGYGKGVVDRLVAAGWITVEERESHGPLPFPLSPPQPPLRLTPEQEEAFRRVENALGDFTPFLLYGVTGSGKTELYLQWGQRCMEEGMGFLLLIPEIALTPQYISRFTARFGERVGVLHSALSPKDRLREWLRIRGGEARVVLGTRSALFAPVDGLGLIVVDEEHDPSFKQEETPVYNARDMALVRGQIEGCPVVLASATPSLESFYNAQKNKYAMLTLSKRVGTPMARVRVVDMGQEEGIFSKAFLHGLRGALKDGGQALVLLNRRGYAAFLLCPKCGETVRCPNCDITLTLHREPLLLRCHYCGYSKPPLDRCKHCGSEMRAVGLGIQRVEEELARSFPEARIDRMDRDALRSRQAHWEVLRKVEEGYTDILLGTQMIAKGHHYPRISFVGVVLADVALHLPDFRAAERTFQILTQVVGRAGRGGRGMAVIQTFMPTHPSVVWAARQDYLSFAAEELERRRALGYPPFSHMARILVTGTNEDRVEDGANKVAGLLRGGAEGMVVLGPAPAPLYRVRNQYRRHIILKGKRKALLLNLARLPRRVGGVHVKVDMDPYSML